VKINNIILMPAFMALRLVVAFGFQQPEAIQPNVTEMRYNPLKYQGKPVRITGWLESSCVLGLLCWAAIENDDGYIGIMPPDRIESDIFARKNALFERLWKIHTDSSNTCKKDIEVEVEGFVKEINEVAKESDPDNGILGILVVTRVIRIEEKYRKPPIGICAEESHAPEIIRSTVPEIRNNPLKYDGKIVQITGWLDTSCGYHRGHGIRVDVDNDESVIKIDRPDMAELHAFVQNDSLFEKIWHICTNEFTCHKDTEVEVEGVVIENKTIPKWFYSNGIRPGVLIVTRVIRIEEKYRKPPEGACIPDTPEEIFGSFPPVQFDLPKPKLNIEITPPKMIQQPNEKRN